MTDREGFLAQIKACKRNVAHLADATPHIFPEWQELQAAERIADEAIARRDQLRKQWAAIKRGNQS